MPKREEKQPDVEQPPSSEPSETEQLKTQLQELKAIVEQLRQPAAEQAAAETPTPPSPTPPSFPAAPAGGASSTADHRAKFLEIYQRNPYSASEYLEKHKSEIAQAARELIS